MSLAVLVIDVQQVFREGEHRAFDAGRVVANINQVTKAAREAGHPVVFIQHASASGPLAHGAPGWHFAHDLQLTADDRVMGKKGTDSFHDTPLETLLRSLGAKELVVCGIQSEFCVDSTVRRALALGFDVRLVEDAHTTLDNGVLAAAQITAHHNTTLANIRSLPGKARLVPAANALR